MTSTFRADLRGALAGLLESFRIAHPNLIRQTYRARPGALHPPMAYVGPIKETYVHDSGTRTRLFEAQLAVVESLIVAGETVDKLDVLADLMLDYLTANPHLVDGTMIQTPDSGEDIELDLGGGTIYAATVFTVRGNKLEGRS